LFETIRIENGQACHLPWHEERIHRARQEFWGLTGSFDLKRAVQVPPEFANGTVRCNVVYEHEIIEILFSSYVKHRVGSLKLVSVDALDYHVKFFDRTALEELFASRGGCDEVIIVKGGLITDTSISNLVFYDGSRWYTPGHPLLEGTCRARLIAGGKIIPLDIRPGDLQKYQGCKLINAMRAMEEEEMIPMERIIYR